MNNEEKDRAFYKYPGTDTLRNKFGIRDSRLLDTVERALVGTRIDELPPAGNFDLVHLQAIHRHLFQDIYDWAGELRQVDFHKGGFWFLPHDRIEMGINDVHRRLAEKDFLRGLPPGDFAREAGIIIGDLNHAHPFREGNGRTQMSYLDLLAQQAGHVIGFERFEQKSWIEASIQANEGRYDLMGRCIENSITGPAKEQSKGRGRSRGWER